MSDRSKRTTAWIRTCVIALLVVAYATLASQPVGVERRIFGAAPQRADDAIDDTGLSAADVGAPSVDADRPSTGRSGTSRAADDVAVDVRAFGATGDGVTDDTTAIQRANDEVASVGGGRVYFPPGTYVAAGVKQDSFVEFHGTSRSILKHPDGVSAEQIVRSRVTSLVGSIEAGSNRLQLSSTSGVVRDAVVAVRGAGGPSTLQRGSLTSAIGERDTLIGLRDADGFSTGSTYRPNFLLIDHEVISYWTLVGGKLTGVKRGLLGTQTARHRRGATVAQLQVLYAGVSQIAEHHVDLDRAAGFGVRGTSVWVGSVGLKVDGLTFDGNRQPGGAPATNPFPVHYEAVDRASITNCTFRNGDDGAIKFDRGTRRSLIDDNTFVDNGSPSTHGGAAIWLFRGSSNNTIRDNVIRGDSYSGVYVDDRTVSSTEHDASASMNLIERNVIDIPRTGSNSAIAILGSSRNTVRDNEIEGTTFGIRVYTGGQGSRLPPTSNNVVEENTLEANSYGIWVDGRQNRFLDNLILDVSEQPVVDAGESNRFS